MAKFAFVLLICLALHSAWSYYGPPSYGPQPYTRIIYRHHVPFHPQMAYMSPMPPPVPFVPQVPFAPPPTTMQYTGARHAAAYFASPSFAHPVAAPFVPAASHQQSYYSSPHMMPPPSSPRYPFRSMAASPFGAYSQPPPKQSFFTKIKPFIFGGTGPRSLPHHPHYPNLFPPHQFSPNRPFLNRPSVHHGYHPGPSHHHGMHHPQKSCSCSLHVGQLTVYKHTDLRSSYSCHDLKDCNNFCTNLFSSEDLRAQTRVDACLIIGKDVKVPWFRRDHACEPHGVKNDTKLSIDLCCKNLQPC